MGRKVQSSSRLLPLEADSPVQRHRCAHVRGPEFNSSTRMHKHVTILHQTALHVTLFRLKYGATVTASAHLWISKRGHNKPFCNTGLNCPHRSYEGEAGDSVAQAHASELQLGITAGPKASLEINDYQKGQQSVFSDFFSFC